MVHTLAEQHGMIATFMPKPFTHADRQRLPLPHVALEDGENVFLDEADPRGLGLSEIAYNFIGGLKAHARAYSALTAPTVNSYKRLKLGSTSSGATWSPVWISYGYNNRTQMLRIPAPGPDRGPHDRRLVQPVSRGRGRARRRPRRDRERKLDAGEPNSENLYSVSYDELARAGCGRCRRTCSEATDELERDDVLRAALGRGRRRGRTSTTTSASSATSGIRYHEQVTAWEVPRVPDPLLSLERRSDMSSSPYENGDFLARPAL